MVMGGVPFYLEAVRTGESAAQNIDRLCFSEDGLLRGEFDNLGPPRAGSPLPFDPTMIKVESLITNGLLFIFFYANMFVLVPKVLTRKGWAPYILLVGLCIIFYLATSYFFRLRFVHLNAFNPPLFIGVPNFFMVFGLSLALRLMQDRSAYENLLKEREHEKLK